MLGKVAFAAPPSLVLAVVLAGSALPCRAAPEADQESSCARLLRAIERLEATLAQETKARAAENDTQRTQLVVTLLGLRYHNIEAIESSLQSAEADEIDMRGMTARGQAQLDALDEASRNAGTSAPDPDRKAQRSEIEASLKGLEERAKGLRDRKANLQGQLVIERHDIEKLEATVRAWLEKSQ